MKATIIFILCFLSLNAFSQVPDYLNNSPEWRIRQTIDWNYPCIPIHDYTLYTNGDTVIGSYTYKRIRKHGKTVMTYFAPPPDNGCNGTTYYNESAGFVRQDALRFYQYIEFVGDTLMYDFDLALGDTTPTTSVWNSGDWIVTSIDSLLINGNYHKKFFLNNGSIDSTFIIQGLGSRAGLFEQFHGFFESDCNLLCYAQNSTTYFPVLDQECDYSVGLAEVEPKEKEVISIIDLWGIETKDKPNTFLIYIYSDGTTEKVFRVE